MHNLFSSQKPPLCACNAGHITWSVAGSCHHQRLHGLVAVHSGTAELSAMFVTTLCKNWLCAFLLSYSAVMAAPSDVMQLMVYAQCRCGQCTLASQATCYTCAVQPRGWRQVHLAWYAMHVTCWHCMSSHHSCR